MLALQNESQLQELEHLFRSSSDGVVHLTPSLFDQYAVGKRRPYTLIVFLTASHLLDKQALNLRGLRKEFGMLGAVCCLEVLFCLHADLLYLLLRK